MELFFANETALMLLVVIPIIIFFHILGFLNLKKKTFKFANYETLLRINKTKVIISKDISQLVFRIIFLALLIFAVAQLNVKVESTGYDYNLVLGIDVSGSMLADDFSPNRLEAVKSNLNDVLENKSFISKVGVFGFTALNYPIISPTNDKLELISTIKEIDIKESSGTSLGNALIYGYALINNFVDEKKNVIVLITDGQENLMSSDELNYVLDFLEEKEVEIFVIGVGTLSGGRINQDFSGSFVINEENFKIFGDDRYMIATNEDLLKSGIENLFVEREGEKIIELDMYLFLLSFILLVFEWYLVNSVFRSFP